MFDTLLKSKFYSKCKGNTKLTKTRIEMIKRKRNAMQKYLRNDIVDLLKNHLDYNAYGRAEGFLVELNLSSCYEILERACACILTRLSPMNKQRECPEECREAVSTLMFAAARFADLPELRALRTQFADRYGNSLEPYVNQELVKKLKSTPPTKDMKLQLLQNIALEQGMEWDAKALEQKLYKPPPPDQNEDNNNELQKRSNSNVWRSVDQEVEDKKTNLKVNISKEREEEHHRPRGRKVVPNDEKTSPLTNKTPENTPSDRPKVAANNDRKDLEKNKGSSEDKTQLSYNLIPPPPYTKQNVSKNETSLKTSPTSNAGKEETTPSKQTEKPKPVAKSVRRRRSNFSEKKQEIADGKDEEEKMMDKLLMHYSKKPSPVEELDQLEELKQKHKLDGVRTRKKSLSGEASTSTAEDETREHARANSFQHEEILGSSSDNANPKPLDYDDFIARLASLRGK